MIRLVEVPPASSPAAAKVVVYACIAPAENVDLDDALRPTLAYVKEQGWEYGFRYPPVPSTTVADDRRSGAEHESRWTRHRG